MKKLILFSLVALFAMSVEAQNREQVIAELNKATELIKAKQYEEGLTALQVAANLGLEVGEDAADIVQSIQTMTPKVRLAVANQYIKAKNYDKAITTLQAAFDDAELMGDQSAAMSASRAISNIYLNQGAEFFNTDKYDKALEIFKKGYEQDPSNVQLALYSAKSYAGLKNTEEASKLFKQVIEAGAANSKYEGEATQAKDDFRIMYLSAASEAAKANDFQSAINNSKSVLEIMPDSPEANLLLIQSANNSKQFDIVIENGEKAATAQTDANNKSAVYFLLGKAYESKSNKPKAIEAFRKVTAGSNVAAAKQLITELSK